jgi:histone deacetylase complex regulatory component SIN3
MLKYSSNVLIRVSQQRTKLHHKPNAQDAPAVSPTLTPILPEPLPPTSTSSATSEELAFFDRVKKYISNKQTMNEFLKLCNLFSQDLVGKDVLVHKVSNFIGGNPDLMNWFKQFVGYDGREEVIENQPKAPTGRVALSNCRGLGPSYRLLPKRVRTHFLPSRVDFYIILPCCFLKLRRARSTWCGKFTHRVFFYCWMGQFEATYCARKHLDDGC